VRSIGLKRERRGELLGVNSRVYVLDTSVLVEYLDKSSPLARKVEVIFKKALNRELTLYTTSLALAETLYVTSKFYKAMGVAKPNDEALNYIIWLKEYVGLKVGNIDEILALKIGELKKKLGIALTDCSIVAYALELKGTALFRKVEKEMKPTIKNLRDLGVLFLSEIPLETP